MADVITTGVDEGERRAERDLGAIANEVEHLAAQLVEHTTTIEGLREDRAWITTRLEAIERDLQAAPKVPEELTRTFTESIANLSSRLERMEAELTDEHETEPPERHESDEHQSDGDEHRDEEKRPSILDRLF